MTTLADLTKDQEQIGLAIGILAAAIARQGDASSLMVDLQEQIRAAKHRYGSTLGTALAEIAELAVTAEAMAQHRSRQ